MFLRTEFFKDLRTNRSEFFGFRARAGSSRFDADSVEPKALKRKLTAVAETLPWFYVNLIQAWH